MGYNSYLTCFEVNKAWRKTLVSERFQKIFLKLLTGRKRREERLLVASKFGNMNEVNHLIYSEGFTDVDCDVRGDWGGWSTPLYESVRRGHVRVVEILLDAGADPDKDTKTGGSPLHMALTQGSKQVTQLL